MRELTFKGFLRQYVKKLSGTDSLDMERLAAEALGGNHRLRAPLVLLAAVSGKRARLSEALGTGPAASEMRRQLRLFSGGDVERVLRSGDVPDAYRKVWDSYLAAHDAPSRDEALKGAMREKVLQLQEEKGCTNYRVYTDLKLNPGNINSWLKQGDNRKVSYRTAERVLTYVMGYGAGAGR